MPDQRERTELLVHYVDRSGAHGEIQLVLGGRRPLSEITELANLIGCISTRLGTELLDVQLVVETPEHLEHVSLSDVRLDALTAVRLGASTAIRQGALTAVRLCCLLLGLGLAATHPAVAEAHGAVLEFLFDGVPPWS